jgi:hypothetical protein
MAMVMTRSVVVVVMMRKLDRRRIIMMHSNCHNDDEGVGDKQHIKRK